MAYILTYNNRPLTRQAGQYDFISFNLPNDVWVSCSWSPSTRVPAYGNLIWTGSQKYYDKYTYYDDDYKITGQNTADKKTWTGTLTAFSAEYIWNDLLGNTYFSNGSDGQHKLGYSSSQEYTWSAKTWSGSLTNPERAYIWDDGTTTYYGSSYYLTGTTVYNTDWATQSFTGTPSNFTPSTGIWHDSIGNTYYSNGSTNYVFNKSTHKWTTKTWSGLTSFEGQDVWIDLVGRVFYSNGQQQYELNPLTSTWTAKNWSVPSSGMLNQLKGRYIWKTDTDVHLSAGQYYQYILT